MAYIVLTAIIGFLIIFCWYLDRSSSKKFNDLDAYYSHELSETEEFYKHKIEEAFHAAYENGFNAGYIQGKRLYRQDKTRLIIPQQYVR